MLFIQSDTFQKFLNIRVVHGVTNEANNQQCQDAQFGEETLFTQEEKKAKRGM